MPPGLGVIIRAAAWEEYLVVKMKIEKYNERYCNEIADLFCKAVHAIDPTLYTEEQKKAWAPIPPDYGFWQQRLEIKRPFLGMVNEQVAGFVELESDGHIDCLYVHPNLQRLGFGSNLISHVIRLAKEGGLRLLYVEASKAACPLFNQMGFLQIQENLIERRGVKLTNYTMELDLS